MSLEIITILMPLDKKLDEISCIFSGRRVTAPEVREVWSNYIELTLGNNIGWQAFWKIPRATCEELNINFPAVVFVEVAEVSYVHLMAKINVLAVEDDMELSEQLEAFLLDLHPTVQQQNSSICIQDIAQCLDNFRFFYQNIWQQWDDDDDKNQDWVASRLELRMKLFRDMQAGLIGPLTVAHTRRLLQEARTLYKHKLALELRQESDDELNEDESVRKCLALEQMEIQHQLDLVKRKIEIVENPYLREKAIEYHLQKQRTKCETDSQKFFVVWPGGKFDALVNLLNEACLSIPEDADIRPCELKTALEQASVNDTVFLCRGTHKISNEMLMSKNLTIRGFPSSSDVILTLEQPGPSLLDWTGAKLNFKGLTFSGQAIQALLSIRGGLVELFDCQVRGDPQNVTTGVNVMPGALVHLINCELSGLDSGIVVETGASLHLIRCNISSCGIGIQISDGAEVELCDCHVLNCSDCGLLLRTSEKYESTEGSLKLLESCELMNIRNTILEDNSRDVLISPMTYLGKYNRKFLRNFLFFKA